jgi:UDP-N-acetylmuramyl pentapeptide phosphotransferase/UDP-N-acetylglucosamine-1-phosphate transferase
MGGLLFFVTMLGSLFVVDYLARERGWNRRRWAVASTLIGPLAIPLIYLVDAACAVRKMMNAPRT